MILLNFEIIVTENATKFDAIWSGFGPHALRFMQRVTIFFQLDENMSKALLTRELASGKMEELFEMLVYEEKTKDQNLNKAKQLLLEVKVPHWDVKQQILREKQKELNKILQKNITNVSSIIEKLLGYKIPHKLKIFLVYSADYTPRFGGCSLNIEQPTIILRLGYNSDLRYILPLFAHELMHTIIWKKPEKEKMHKISNCLEEALFDLLFLKIECDLKGKINWDVRIKNCVDDRDGFHKKYIYTLFEMLKPVLLGKEDLVWKYIDWKKLKGYRKG